MQKPATVPTSPFRNDAVTGRVALITGGGSGIGFEIARQLGLHGAKVCIVGRRGHVLAEACARLRKDGVECYSTEGDVRSFESCEKAVANCVREFGHLDILVNNAAGNFIVPFEDLSPKGFRTVMEIDAFGTFHSSQAAFHELKKAAQTRGDACIINITAEFNSPPLFAAHAAAAKMAVDSMTRSMSLEWSDYGIRVNGIAPGPIADTAGFSKLGGMGSGDTGVDRKNSVSAPAQTLPRGIMAGLTWDIGMAAVFYCSTAGGYISGDTMRVDGGSYLRKGIARKPDGTLRVDRAAVRQVSRERERQQRKAPVGVAGTTAKL